MTQFESWAATYDSSPLQKRYFHPVQRALLHHYSASVAPNPSHVLDIGCGTGSLLRRARSAFPGSVLVGIDPAPSMLRAARARLCHPGPSGRRAVAAPRSCLRTHRHEGAGAAVGGGLHGEQGAQRRPLPA
ncbi:class I SAM-dependent methyltransferase [Streptomyces netropsis]|uniref:Ubiquinone/menaquinone biosynthesis C-methylase UbiE n=1 Tax=Streptomyces netropsis TaxID=55404 RepID=A0A7W7PF84_STRNE|nr:class I SAM-dependent methyltransferase [Streptomyces netropsis]MBB4887447.1 ubiquinone/menaquinone biosynthesis C-methylase UbiE [Streptomyces netropsis]GGR10389.1 hypothetical protein GCM10010219_13840 [Streptomyces netropsis]